MVGKTDFDLFPETATRLVKLKRKVLKTGLELNERLWVVSGGRRFYLEIFLEPLRDSHGEITGVGVAGVDQTKLKLVEEALRENQDRFQSFMDNSPTIAWIKDEDGNYIYFSRPYEKRFKIRSEDWRGKNDFAIWPKDVAEIFTKNDRLALHTDRPVYVIDEVPNRDDSKSLWWTFRFPFKNASGQRFIGGIGIDITKSRQAEQEVESLAMFPRENPSPIMRVSQDGTLLYANRASQRILRNWKCKVGNPVPEAVQQVVADVLSVKTGKSKDFSVGKVVYSIIFAPIPDSELVNLYGRDVTEWFNTMEDLRQARDELEQRVIDRTEELINSNTQLQLEADERTRVEESLRHANVYNRGLIESSLDPLVTITQDGKVGDVNRATELITGYSREELIGTSFDEYFTEPEYARAGYQKVFETGSVYNYELNIRHKNGQITPVLYNASVYYDEAGQVLGVFAAARDISERKKAERQLMMTNELLERAFTCIDIHIAYLDHNFNFLRVNRAYAEGAGHEPEFFIGKNHFALYPSTENEAIFKHVVETGDPFSVYEKPFKYTESHDRGATYWDWSAQPVKGVDGTVIGLVLSMVDVTERFQTRKALEEERQRLLIVSQAERKQRLFGESLARATLSLNASLDINTVFDHILEQIRSVIPFRAAAIAQLEDDVLRIVRHLGIEEINGFENAVSGDIPLKSSPIMWKAFTTHEVVVTLDAQHDSENLGFPAVGGVKSQLTAPLQVHEDVVGFLILLSDQANYFNQDAADRLMAFASQAALAIQNARHHRDLQNALSQEQLVRKQLIQAEKFAATGRMLAAITHELNNPLQTIRNCMFLIQNQVPADSETSNLLSVATSETERLSNLVAQLREIYRPKTSSQTEPLKIFELIGEVHTLLGSHLVDAHVQWIQPPSDQHLPPNMAVYGILDQIKQVFINICMNAIEAMQPTGGTLTIKIQMVDDKHELAVIIQDTGQGIAEDELPRLFEPLYTTKAKGLGLGLPICYDIIQKHNGRIQVESQLGIGTTFMVLLPLTESRGIQKH